MPGHEQPHAGYAAPTNPYAPASDWAADPPNTSTHGDAAGEHLTMKRGRFSAWPYVVLAFLAEIFLVGLIPSSILGVILDAAGAPREAAGFAVIAGMLVGIPVAYFVFRDRWRCIEAFSSRFCVGLMNISILFVPAIALVYANVRGFQKLARK
ncbi:Hypothetical protein A7982_02603 [Minicystis rosea]|nr:Hypothetical protein A7982_02603 [Minicystis rosea]